MWVALFSQSGKELYRICENIGQYPDVILTNNKNVDTWYEDTWKLPNICTLSSKEIHNYLYSLDNSLVTLHGYTRIIPTEITEKHTIFNGHPGDIITYPELKGKDPQEKAFNLKLPSSGSVIHRATPELDGGEIYYFRRLNIDPAWSLDELYGHLRSLSIDMWSNFLNELLWNIRQEGKQCV